MKIAVLSGKGGTGKTLLSVNLARTEGKSVYVDCDIEEPNGHLFFKPKWEHEESVTVALPDIDINSCTGCRACVEFCKFNALAYVKDRVYVFDDVCHSCGGCKIVCPVDAISDRDKVIGSIKKGRSGEVRVISGMLNVGEMTGTPLIKNIMKEIEEEENPVVIDCPPGSACIVMDSIRDADYCILVAEPTVFGRHNLEMVYELVTLMNKPFGIVLNKCMGDNNPSEDFCIERGIEILGKIPFDSDIGKLNSEGEIVAEHGNKYKKYFYDIMSKVKGALV